MKTILIIVLIAWGTQCRAQSVHESITVEILGSEQKYQSIVKEYLVSLNTLLEGACPFKNQSKLGGIFMPDAEYLEEGIQKIKKQDIARSVI